MIRRPPRSTLFPTRRSSDLAAVGKSSGDLLDRVVTLLPDARDADDEAEISVAVVGRPNVGKSSLVNRLLGEERLVVADEPGTTRDAIDTPLRYHGRTLVFIDTAGLRKRSKVDDEIEFYSTLRASRAIERADVSVLVVDAKDGMHVQDLKIANERSEEHTSELQSRLHLVCRLLLEKKKIRKDQVESTNAARCGECVSALETP